MKKVIQYLLFFLFLFFFIRELSVIFEKSITCDEIVHIPAGYFYVKKGDYFINYAHPPLCKILSGLFLSFLNINFPEKLYEKYRFTEWDWGLGLMFFLINKGIVEYISFFSRFSLIFLGILLGFFIYKWSKDLYGVFAGLFSLFLFSFCPNFLAYSCLVITDTGITLFFIMTIYFLWKYYKSQNKKDLYFSGISFGLALSTKFSAFYILSLVVLLIFIYGFFKKRLIVKEFHFYFLSFIVIPLFILFAFYQFNPENLKWFIKGAKRVFSEVGETGQEVYLNGVFSKTGFRTFFLWVFLYKTPISFIIILLISFLIYPKINENEKFLLFPAILYFIIASMSKKQVGGVRYILPFYAFLYIFVGRLFLYHEKIKLNLKFKKTFILILILWYAFVSLKIHPHYLAYFNQIAGGPDYGWKRLLNIDWGQDLTGLKVFLEKEGNPEIMLNHFDVLPPEVYGIINYEPFMYQAFMSISEEKYHINSENPKKEYLIISVNPLAGLHYEDHNIFWYLKERKPDKKIGYSIFVYDITNNIYLREKIAETLEKYGFKRQAKRQRKVIENLKKIGK
ncbi:MAG: glycosyltransferase family 39 protein [Candidatus Omnitrophica bacterium]|nr:glycosyltransferase family 39 protein [Candidatus Omnitrophota bacterium]